MKKILFSAVCLLTFNSLAQMAEITEQSTLTPNYGAAEASPVMNNKPMASSKALWDVQFSADVTTAANGSVGQAAVAYINNEIWTSMWASDTIIRYTSAGAFISKFIIAGVSGTRSMTTDGVNLYIGNATNTIFVVNPGTQTLSSTITSAAAVSSRFLTYDPTLNGGAGGFWTGNFNTDIAAIDMSGAVLSTIPAATHTLSGMYGAAVDNVSFGGPYLWVFHQGGANNTEITALSLPAGTPSVYTHDALPDLTTPYSLTSGLAGGAFFTTSFAAQPTLFGLVQGTPVNVVVAYEINISAASWDVAVNSVRPTEGYTKVPLSQIFSETFTADYQNLSTSSVDTIYGDFDFYYNSVLVNSETFQAANVASGATGTFTSSGFPMSNGIGVYDVVVSVYPDASVTDGTPSNDVYTFTFDVTDSIFARDDNMPTGNGYNVSTTDSAYAVSLFTVNVADTCTGIWIQLETPVHGDSTFGLIFNYSGSMPSTEVARGPVTIIDSMQNIYYLQFPGDVVLNPGTYAFGCYEGVNTTIGLAQSNSLFTAGVNYFMTATSGWTASGIPTARFIRPVFGHPAGSSGLAEETTNQLFVYPVPVTDLITVEFAQALTEDGELAILDMNGRVVMTSDLAAGATAQSVELKGVQAGTYLLKATSGNTFMVRTIVVR